MTKSWPGPGADEPSPYWPVCGGWLPRALFERREPVRSPGGEPVYQPAIPSLKRRHTLSFARGEANELSLLLSFPGVAPMYPLGPYPMVAEFRAMLRVCAQGEAAAALDGNSFTAT